MAINKVGIMMLSDDDKDRLTNYANETITFILSKTKDDLEIAFLLKVMVEGFQDSRKCTIPINMRPQ